MARIALHITEGLSLTECKHVNDEWLADTEINEVVLSMRIALKDHLSEAELARKALAIRMRYMELDAILISKQMAERFQKDDDDD